MLSMFSTSLRGLHAGRHLPEQLDLDSLLVLSASQSGSLLEEQGVGAGRWWRLLVEEAISERMAVGTEEEEEEDRGRLWMMLLMVSLKSLRRLVEEEEEVRR